MAGVIFINYRRQDDPGAVQGLLSRLENAFSSDQIFIDVDSIAAGYDFVAILEAQVARCDVLLAVIGPRWLDARDEKGARRVDDPEDFVRIEIEAAMKQSKRVIPVLVTGAQMPRAADLPESLRPFARRNAVRLTHERFKADVQGLIKDIVEALAEADARRASERIQAEETAQKEKEELAKAWKRLDAISRREAENTKAEEERRQREFEEKTRKQREAAEAQKRLDAISRREAENRKAEEERRQRGVTRRWALIFFGAAGAVGGGGYVVWGALPWRNSKRTLNEHASVVQCIAFSPDGRTLASGSWDKTIKLWNAGTGRFIRSFEVGSVWSVTFSPDGRTLASGGGNNTVKLWDAGTGRLIRSFEGHVGSVWSVTFSPDGRTLASGSVDQTVKLWDVGTGRLIRSIEGYANSVESVAFSPDGRTLASGSGDNTVKLWSVSS